VEEIEELKDSIQTDSDEDGEDTHRKMKHDPGKTDAVSKHILKAQERVQLISNKSKDFLKTKNLPYFKAQNFEQAIFNGKSQLISI
jgi:hypothetical protein